MKLRLLLSLLFIITTTLSALHELKHIGHDHANDSSCLVYHLNDKLSSVDIIDEIQKDYTPYFEKIAYSSQVSNLHTHDKSNPDRAPPFHS